MSTRVVVPELSETVSEATVGRWLKKEGEQVREGEALVELQTDKVDLEVGAEIDGVLARIEHAEGDAVEAGDVLGILEEREVQTESEAPAEELSSSEESEESAVDEGRPQRGAHDKGTGSPAPESPAGAREPEPSGPPGRKRDREQARQRPVQTTGSRSEETFDRDERPEERRPLSRRRRTIARRLVESQKETASLTTFNDVDMSAVASLREQYRDDFRERHGVKLGILPFFVKASVAALKLFPRVNSELAQEELVLKRYYDVGIAVADPNGLVVPVLRHCDRMSFAEVETSIEELASRAREGTLGIEDLRGGTFTITNGGVFGSLLSTPILNPPQVAILGLHRIEDRPVARSGRVEVRPMMYLALSYDHRVLDGDEAVQFLGTIKRLIEEPAALLFEA